MRLGVFAADVVSIVGRYQRKALSPREVYEARVDLPLFGYAMIHELDIEVAVAEYLEIPVRRRFRLGVLAPEQGFLHLSFEACGERYESR